MSGLVSFSRTYNLSEGFKGFIADLRIFGFEDLRICHQEGRIVGDCLGEFRLCKSSMSDGH